MELEFIKKGNSYEAIFEVPSDFNIHIELDKPSYLGIYQSSIQDGEYSFTTEYKLNDIQKIYDIDFAALVYPKFIKVVSGSEVASASVNFNVGGGSGTGESGEASTVEYLDLSGYSENSFEKTLTLFSIAVKTVIMGQNTVGLTSYLSGQQGITTFAKNANQIEIDFSRICAITANSIVSVKDAIASYGITQEQLDAIPRITKEQFYNLEA